MFAARFSRELASTLYRADEALSLAHQIQLSLEGTHLSARTQETPTCHCLWRPNPTLRNA